jgi:hypothetical protein
VSSCTAGYAKPSWQAGTGVPADGVRDVPDVSLFASAGVGGDYFAPSIFNSFYIVCQQDLLYGATCGLNAANPEFVGVGGTSASSPQFAAILSLVNQKTGSRQGNANYVFYRLAAQQNATACNSATGSGSSCIFNDVTTGTNATPCRTGTPNCVTTTPGDFYGVTGSYQATTGYDLATGLGSVNIANLVNGWAAGASFKVSSTTLSLSPTAAVHGSPITVAATVTSQSGTPTGLVAINGATTNGSVGEGTLTNGVLSESLRTLPGGTYAVEAHYAGDGTYAGSDSMLTTVTISPEPSTGQIVTKSYDPFTGVINTVTTAPYGTLFVVRANVSGVSGFGAPTGSLTLTDNGNLLDIGTYALNQEGYAEDFTTNLLAGQHMMQFSYSGDASFEPGTVTQALTVTPMVMQCLFEQPNTTVLELGWGLDVGLSANAAPTRSGPERQYPNGTTVAPGGTVTFYSGTTVLAGPIPVTGTGGAYPIQNGGITSLQIPTVFVQYFIPASAFSASVTSVTAVYSGDANHSGCAFPPIALTYQSRSMLASTTEAFYTTPTVAPGVAVPFTVVVVAQTPPPVYEPAYPAPTGSVQVLMDGKPTGSSVPLSPASGEGMGSFSLATTGLSNGNHLITFSYPGDSNYAASVSGGYGLTIVGPDFTLTSNQSYLTVTNGNTTSAALLLVTDTNGFIGAVTFSCSGLPNGASCNFTQNPVSGNGSSTLTISTTKASVIEGRPSAALDTGSRGWSTLSGAFASACLLMWLLPGQRRRVPKVIPAVICAAILAATTSCGSGGSGSGTGGGTSAPGLASTSTTISASSSAPAEKANDTFTATVTPLLGRSTAPGGSVSFLVDNASAGTPVVLNGTTAVLTTAFSAAGSHTVSATYSGDTNYSSSSSGSVSIMVPYANGSIPGTYTLQVTATSGTLSHTAAIQLVVQ